MRSAVAGRSPASTALARSSACPPAILAIRSAVAGATTTRSVSRASRIWPTSNSLRRVEEIHISALARDGARRQRRDEFLRRPGHHHAHRGAALLEPPDQVERLIGRDPAADNEEDTLAMEWIFSAWRHLFQRRFSSNAARNTLALGRSRTLLHAATASLCQLNYSQRCDTIICFHKIIVCRMAVVLQIDECVSDQLAVPIRQAVPAIARTYRTIWQTARKCFAYRCG